MPNSLQETARALLDELDGNEYLTHKVIDSARIRDAKNALRTALAAEVDRVSVPVEPTQLMVAAGCDRKLWASQSRESIVESIYRAMIDLPARPKVNNG